jgi:ankyrin repeat protein
MVALLLDLGADPLGVDAGGMTAAAYAMSPDIDRSVMEKIRAMTTSELTSATRGDRPSRGSLMDLVANIALGDWKTAGRLVKENPKLIDAGALHLMAKRNNAEAVKWLLDHGADPNARWSHWEAEVTPLHLAASQGHADVVRLLLAAGADASIRDSAHDGDALGWAEFFRQPEIIRILKAGPPET